MIRVVVVSPALAVRAGLRTLLGDRTFAGLSSGESQITHTEIEVVGEASDLAEIESSESMDVLLVTADAFPDADLDESPGLVEDGPALILLFDPREDIQELGGVPDRVTGMLSLDSTAEELSAAVNAVHEGLFVGEPALVRRYYSKDVFLGSSPDVLVDALTERETEVLQLVAAGLANKQIAARLDISEHTVKFHVSSIYSKMRVTNRAEAVRTGIQQGLVSI